MAEVTVAIGGQEVVAAITRGSVERLALQMGDPVMGISKATEVMREVRGRSHDRARGAARPGTNRTSRSPDVHRC